MIFAKDFCPICKYKLRLDVSGGIRTFFCIKQSMEVEIVGAPTWRTKTSVFHYSHRIYDTLNMGSLSEIIIPPYMIRWCQKANLTKVFFLPDGDESPKLVADIPFLHITSFDKNDLIEKIKTLVTFS